jgi:hypothetical protein
MTLVFSIAPSGSFDLGAVVKSAYRYLDGSVTVMQEAGCVYASSRKQDAGRDEFGTCRGYDKPFGALLLLQLKSGERGVFRVIPRPSTDADFAAAKAAAAQLELLDLGEVAVRCQTVLEVSPDVVPEFASASSQTPKATLSICAVLATAARGPILLEDGGLLDAKAAWERLQQLVETAA